MLTLIPREVFVGDTAEIIYSFIPDNSILQILNSTGTEKQVTVEISSDNAAFDAVAKSCTVSKASVVVSQAECVVHVTFIPWKTGVIDFPSFDLFDAVQNNEEIQNQFMIDIPSVTISSIIEKTGRNSLQKVEPPILVPGTTYAVYACIFIGMLILVLISIAVTRFNWLKKRMGSLIGRFCLPRHTRKALRRLKKLHKNITSFTVAVASGELSNILRDYLEFHFGYHFTAVSTPELMSTLSNITAETADEQEENLFFEISSLCVRLDYLRFSGVGEIQATQKEAGTDSEIIKLCDTVKSLIMRLEADNVAL